MPPRHCLIVDDDADFRAVLSRALARRGYRVSHAADVSAGLAVAQHDPPDDVV